MTINQKTILLHRIHYWASLDINVLICLLLFVIHCSTYDLLLPILFFFAMSIDFSAAHISRDMEYSDTSDIVFRYFCVLAISCILVYELYVKTTLVMTMMLVIAIVIEILMIFVIIYRYKIRNKIMVMFNKKVTNKKKVLKNADDRDKNQVIVDRKKQMFFRIYCDVSIIVNFLLSGLVYVRYTSNSNILWLISVVSVIYIIAFIAQFYCNPILKKWYVIVQYVKVSLLSCVFVSLTYIYTSFKAAMIPSIAIVIEIFILFVIIYRYKIRNKIIKLFKKK